MTRAWIIAALSVVLATVAVLLPFWWLGLLGVLLAVSFGQWFLGVVLGLLLDLFFGPPVGFLQVLVFPFTGTAVLAALGRFVLMRNLRQAPSDTL